MGAKKCKSTYCRKGKAPFQYSVHYNEWKRNMKPPPHGEAAEQAAQAHERQFGYTRNKGRYDADTE